MLTLGLFDFIRHCKDRDQRSAAALQKQCILVRTFVPLWSALQPPCNHMCHQSTAKAERDQQPRPGAAVAQNQLQSLDDNTLYSHWLDYVMTYTRCVACVYSGWDVKPRSWLSVVIKNPMAILVKSMGVTPVSWPNSHHWHVSISLLIIPIHLIGSLTLSPLHL